MRARDARRGGADRRRASQRALDPTNLTTTCRATLGSSSALSLARESAEKKRTTASFDVAHRAPCSALTLHAPVAARELCRGRSQRGWIAGPAVVGSACSCVVADGVGRQNPSVWSRDAQNDARRASPRVEVTESAYRSVKHEPSIVAGEVWTAQIYIILRLDGCRSAPRRFEVFEIETGAVVFRERARVHRIRPRLRSSSRSAPPGGEGG